MTIDEGRREGRSLAARARTRLGRRGFVAGASGLAAALGGCLGSDPSEDEPSPGDGDGSGGDDGETPSGGIDESTDDRTDDGATADETDSSAASPSSAPFRLLISDRPADIGDFEELTVVLDSARIFRPGGDDQEEPATSDDDADGEDEEDAEAPDDDDSVGDDSAEEGDESDADGDEEEGDESDDETASDDEDSPESSDEGDDETDDAERNQGFSVLDLDGQSVDLTTVVGERAVSVFEGDLEEGRYSKIELHVETATGIVDGEEVAVKVPSEKLQITRPFELTAENPIDFVFDINVVRRGRGHRYNLLPVIAESGIAGEDVDVEEIAPGENEDEEIEDEEPASSDDSGDA